MPGSSTASARASGCSSTGSAQDEGATFAPTVLLVGGDGAPELAPAEGAVTARILGDTKGPKIRIGKYKKRTGYRRHTGFRASLTQIEIESIGAQAAGARDEGEGGAGRAGRRAREGHARGLRGADGRARSRARPPDWNRPMLEAALEYEQAHAKRKGALAAIESALADKEGDS